MEILHLKVIFKCIFLLKESSRIWHRESTNTSELKHLKNGFSANIHTLYQCQAISHGCQACGFLKAILNRLSMHVLKQRKNGKIVAIKQDFCSKDVP